MGDKDDDKEKSAEKSSERSGIGDIVKEMTMSGLATLFMTEDSVRNYIKDLKLPKEFISALLDGASKKKDDMYDVVAKEVGKFLGKVDLTKEAAKFLEQHHIHFEAKVSFEPRDEKVKKEKEK